MQYLPEFLSHFHTFHYRCLFSLDDNSSPYSNAALLQRADIHAVNVVCALVSIPSNSISQLAVASLLYNSLIKIVIQKSRSCCLSDDEVFNNVPIASSMTVYSSRI